MNIKKLLSTVFLLSRIYPNGCKSGNELDWMFKDCCPVCLASPIEPLSNMEYQLKYPAKNKLHFGRITIYLCDKHLNELKDTLNKWENKE